MQDTLKIDTHFTVLPNEVVRDKQISIEARGMLGLIVSMSEDWKFWRSKMMELSGCKKHKYYRILTELQEAGYLSIEDDRDDQGKFIGKAWIVHNNPCTENQDPDKPVCGEISTHKNNNLNKNNNLEEDTPVSPKEDDLFDTNLPTVETKSDVEICFDEFNAMAERNDLPKCQAQNKTRTAKLKKRLKDCGGVEGWRAALAKVEASDFLLGRTSGFKCSIDFLLQESSFTKLMEGNYDNRINNTSGSGNGSKLSSHERLGAVSEKMQEAVRERGITWDELNRD